MPSDFLIDPTDVIDFERSESDLELFWLFSAVVAGKTATTQARLLERFLSGLEGGTPFDRIQLADRRGILLDRLIESRLGQYNRLHRMFVESLRLNLRTCTVEDLEAIHGCGPKTARMFLMFTRPDQEYAALDTHLLKHLRAKGINAPKTTPSGRKYRELETQFLKLVEASGMTVAEYDLKVWKEYANPSGDYPNPKAVEDSSGGNTLSVGPDHLDQS